MNSYLLELLANEKVEARRCQARRAQMLGCSRSPALKSVGRFGRSRLSINRACESTPLVDCR